MELAKVHIILSDSKLVGTYRIFRHALRKRRIKAINKGQILGVPNVKASCVFLGVGGPVCVDGCKKWRAIRVGYLCSVQNKLELAGVSRYQRKIRNPVDM